MISTHIAIFASGAGSNALKIIERFAGHNSINVTVIVTNNPNAGVLAHAEKNHVKTLVVNKADFFGEDSIVSTLKQLNVNYIVLAGFLWKVPAALVKAFNGRIINIHPALLPKYGGKGMYGNNVHEAVINAGEQESGITIHMVDEHYDNGDVIFQATCPVDELETPESLAKKIHLLEHMYFPQVIEEFIMRLSNR